MKSRFTFLSSGLKLLEWKESIFAVIGNGSLRVMIDTEGPLSFKGGVHICARALLDINLIWFGYIACLSQKGGRGHFTRSSDFYMPSLRLERGGVSILCLKPILCMVTEPALCKMLCQPNYRKPPKLRRKIRVRYLACF
jgi:hypothetical protein